MYDFIQVILILAVPLLYPRLGAWVFTKLCLLLRRQESLPRQFLLFMMGLLVHITGIFILKCCYAPWCIAFFLPLVPIFFVKYRLSFPRLSLNFVIWFFVILVSGVSLFQTVNGIETPWVNNYGDLTFHFGMINSFVKNDTFPPQYHVYAGEPLTYPFFINLWSAAFWWLSQSYYTLHFIFIVQWVILWSVVFFALNGNRYRILPWAIFFGGGTFHEMNTWSWSLIHSGQKPWTTFITSIWVTQRSMLFGVAVLLSALYLLYEIQKRGKYQKSFLVYSVFLGLMLALSPLTHAHAILVAGLFCGFIYITWVLKKTTTSRVEKYTGFMAFAGSSLLGLFFLPWLSSKTSMMKIIYGWTVNLNRALPEVQIEKSLELWGYCGIPLLIAFIVYWTLTKKHLEALAIIGLFILGNTVLFAQWQWDQIKYFIALYSIMIFLWSNSRDKTVYYVHYCLLILCIPAIYEVGRICVDYKQNTPYSRESLIVADEIEGMTEPSAIIAAKPSHNSPVTLSGRTLYMGYLGTLSSHAIKYGEREKIMKDMNKLCECERYAEEGDAKNCPDYLLWTDEDKKYFGVNPCIEAKQVSMHIYKLPKKKI